MEASMTKTCCDDKREDEPQPIGEILEQLLAQYEAKYPNTCITVVETAATAI
jgi:hypothetical protein